MLAPPKKKYKKPLLDRAISHLRLLNSELMDPVGTSPTFYDPNLVILPNL